jgi:hypothetical protein
MHAPRAVLSSVLTVGLVALVGSAAHADPKHGMTLPLVCGGHTYLVAVNGNGQFSPAHDTASTLVFVPHYFGPFTSVIRNAQGVVVDTSTDPAVTQGSGKQKNDVSCTYSFTQVSDGSDPTFPAGWTFSGSGSVTGQVAG